MFGRLRHFCRAQTLQQATQCLCSIGTSAQSSRLNSAIVSVTKLVREDSSKMLSVTWNDNTVNRYPYIYLRDNCQCPKCFQKDSLQRALDLVGEIDLNIDVGKVEVLQNGEQISVVWPDKHVSVYNSEWLHERRFPEQEDLTEKRWIARDGVEVWNNTRISSNFKEFEFEKIMESDNCLFNWLHTLASWGIALIKNVPVEKGQVARITDRVGYFKTTHYGHIFHVESKQGLDLNNLAYTNNALPLHVDIPQCEYIPGLQILHCIKQAPLIGGENMFVDGFNVAQQFKDAHPHLYNLLSKVPIPYWDTGTDSLGAFHQKYARPVIELDHEGWIVRFCYNNHVRDYHMTVPAEMVQEVYKGYIALGKLCRNPTNRFDYKLKPGDMITFNNSRVLHGRNSFTLTKNSSRLLEGAYMDWDLVNSRIRVLGRQLNEPVIV